MKKILIQLTCRYCFYQTHKESESLVLPDIEKDLKKRLLEDTYFSAYCPCCGSKIEFLHTCLYVDKKNGYMLYMKPKRDQKDDDHEQFEDQIKIRRYISDHKDIAEKIRILEDHFDDRIIEIMKQKLYRYMSKKGNEANRIEYRDYDDHSETLWFDVTNGGVIQQMALTRKSYDDIQERFIDIRTPQFKEINEEWAKMYLANEK